MMKLKKIKIFLLLILVIIVGSKVLSIPKVLKEVKKIPSAEKTFIENYNEKLFVLKNNLNKKIEILDNQFKLIYELKSEDGNFQNIVAVSNEKIIFNQGNKTYLLKNKNELLEFDFLIQENIEKNLYIVVNTKGNKGIVDENLVIKIPFNYDKIINLKNSMFAGIKGSEIFLIDLSTDEIKPIKDKAVGFFSNGNDLAIVNNEENKFGFINKKGELKIGYEYIKATPFLFNKSVVKNEIENLIIDKNNKVIYKNPSDVKIEILNEENILLEYRDFSEIYNLKSGKILCFYDWIGGKVGNKLLFLEKGKFGIINLEGDVLIEPIYFEIGILDEETIIVQNENKKYEIYYKENNLKKEYDYLLKRENNLIVMNADSGNFGVISRNGEVLTPEEYVEIKISANKFLAERLNGNYDIYLGKNKLLSDINLNNILSITDEMIILNENLNIVFYQN